MNSHRHHSLTIFLCVYGCINIECLIVYPISQVMYESNWFVSAAMGDTYETAALHVRDALERKGASGAETGTSELQSHTKD